MEDTCLSRIKTYDIGLTGGTATRSSRGNIQKAAGKNWPLFRYVHTLPRSFDKMTILRYEIWLRFAAPNASAKRQRCLAAAGNVTMHIMVQITPLLDIPDQELSFTTARSSGPGGQHVNTTETKVTLQFNVPDSPSLSETQKQRIQRKLCNRINSEGILQISAEERRSQKANREAAVQRFAALLAWALARPKPRKPTRPGKNAVERRLQKKKQRSEIKKQRSKVE